MPGWTAIVSFFAGLFSSASNGINNLINMKNASVILLFLGISALGLAIFFWFGFAASQAFIGLVMVGIAYAINKQKGTEDDE